MRSTLAKRRLTPAQRTARYRTKYPERVKKAVRECHRKRRALWASFLVWLKELACLDCNTHYPKECMEFDHRPGARKRFNITQALYWVVSQVSFLAEIQKCDLVCANCHRLRTAQRRMAA